MTNEKEVQEALKRRGTAQSVVMRHANSVTKFVERGDKLTKDDAEALQGKITEALDKFVSCHGVLLDVCAEGSVDASEYVSTFDRINSDVNTALATIPGLLTSSEPPVTSDGNEDPGQALSPGSKKTLSLIQMALSGLNLNQGQSRLEQMIKEQDDRHKKETKELKDLVTRLQSDMRDADTRQRNLNMISTPNSRYASRVTFNDTLSSSGDGMNEYAAAGTSHGRQHGAQRLISTSTRDTVDVRPKQGDCTWRTGADSRTVSEQRGSGEGIMHSGCQRETGSHQYRDQQSFEQQLIEQSMYQHRSLMATLKAPAVKLPTFSGDPLEYADFIHAFNELVDEVLETPRAKLTSLLAHCTGKARRAIAGQSHRRAAEGYAAARKILESKFGSPYVVSQAWIQKLMAYQSLSVPDQLEGFAMDLVACRDSLVSLNCVAELRCTNNMQALVAKLPYHMRNQWRKRHRAALGDTDSDELSILIELVEEAAADLTDPAYSEAAIAKLRTQEKGGQRFNTAGRRGNVNWLEDTCCAMPGDSPGGEELYHVGRQRVACSSCGSTMHFTSRCRDYRSLKPGDRLQFVKSKGLCLLCLSSDHKVGTCTLQWKCQDKGCSERHHTSLHGAFVAEQSVGCVEEEAVNSCNTDDDTINEDGTLIENGTYLTTTRPTLPLTPVIVRSGNKSVSTYALLDQGSTLTLCHKRVANQLELKPVGYETVNVNTVNDRSKVSGPMYNFDIAGLKIKRFLPVVEALEVDRLPISLNHMATASQFVEWKHLSDLDIGTADSSSVDLLIVTDNSHLLEPYKKRKGKLFEPYAVLTPLGWTVFNGTKSRPSVNQNVFSIQANQVFDAYEGEPDILPSPVGGKNGQAIVCSAEQAIGIKGQAPVECESRVESPIESRAEPHIEQHTVTELTNDPTNIPPKGDSSFEVTIDTFESMLEMDDNEFDGAFDEVFSTLINDDDVISEQFHERMSEFFKVEEVPPGPQLTKDEQYVKNLWDSTWELIDGHITLPIPFRSEPPNMPNNYRIAYAALMCLRRRFLRDPEYFRQYSEAINKEIASGYAELVTDLTSVDLRYLWFLLHHAVSHARKPGVLRVVKHGNTEYHGRSLGKECYQGPDLMNSLVEVMMRFRRYKTGVAGDVEGMYNQVKVPTRQRDCMSYLWFEKGDLNGKVVVYRMTTHIFGMNWSPAAANYALRKTVEIEPVTAVPRVVESINDDFYVDDWLNSEESDTVASMMVTEVKSTLAKGGFNIGKFTSNSRTVLSSIDVEDRAKELAKLDLYTEALPQGFTLGSGWDQEKDCFGYSIKKRTTPRTRRSIMSYVASFFDPLGFLAPFLFPAKVLMRATCRAGKSWDSVVPQELAEQWDRWFADVDDIERFRIARWIGCRSGCTNELHVFGDACELGYGAAGVVCVRNDGDYVDSSLVMSKSKLAPAKTQTIPRLELCAAVMALDLGTYLQNVLGIELCAVYYWSDSSIVLRLMLGDPAQFKPFMGNRIAHVQRHSDVAQWDHVPGSDNPADLVSRGTTMRELVGNRKWLKGPEFLTKRKEQWPTLRGTVKNLELDTTEMKKNHQIYTMSDDEFSKLPEIAEEYVNFVSPQRDVMVAEGTEAVKEDTQSDLMATFLKLRNNVGQQQRLVAWIQRVLKWKFDGAQRFGPLTVEDIAAARVGLVKANQRLFLSKTQRDSMVFKKLCPVEVDGVFRVGGRVTHASFDHDIKHPYIVPADGPLTEQIIASAHLNTLHGGVERTLCEVRRFFWLLGGRRPIDMYIKKCVTCRRLNGATAKQLMSDLPEERIDLGAPPFSNTGIDLFGPIKVVVRRGTEKRYGVIFSCMTTRAVHIEVAIDLSASAFLNTLYRFVARRGRPKRIRTDNGTNFVKSRGEVTGITSPMTDRKVQTMLTDKGIEWVMNTPGASHHGGAWERMIRSIRKLMVVLLNEGTITPDRLETALCIIEQTLNDRPLTRLSDNPHSVKYISPSHILNLRTPQGLIVRDFSGERLRKDWRQSQYLADIYWRRWTALYLPDLQKRSKWLGIKSNLKKGELVLLVGEQQSRGEWPMGIIEDVFPGDDGLVRSVAVRTTSGVYRRPITKVVRLEGDEG